MATTKRSIKPASISSQADPTPASAAGLEPLIALTVDASGGAARELVPAQEDQAAPVLADAGASAASSANVPVPRVFSRLVSQEDVMEVHTYEAMRMYTGLTPDASQAEHRFGVPGARRAASALRQLFLLTAMDNPYADWVLIDTDERVAAIKNLIEQTRRVQLGRLDALKAKGLRYSILRAEQPQSLSLGYHSPYGYMMSTLIVMLDECVRVLKSAERRDLLTRRETHELLQGIKRAMRSMFEVVLRGQRVLTHEHLRALKRSDFMPQPGDSDDSSEQAKRVQAVRAVFGTVPADIFSGQRQPRHSLRNERLSAQEMKLLQTLAQDQQAQDAQEAQQGQSTGATAGVGAGAGAGGQALID